MTAEVNLPLDLFEAAAVIANIKPAWDDLVNRLKDVPGADHATKCDVMDVRPKQVRRPRKPRLVTPPQDAA
jgi:hypothetical protein